MSSVVISGDTSGSIAVTAPAVAGSNTFTLPAATGTAELIGLGTAVASTSGTAIDFTNIPSWAKRITVILAGVSTSGTSAPLIQVGSGSIATTGYVTMGNRVSQASGSAGNSATNGFTFPTIQNAGDLISCTLQINLISGFVYVGTLSGKFNTNNAVIGGGDVTLSGLIDRVRVTTTNGTDTFDAGSINIMWEG